MKKSICFLYVFMIALFASQYAIAQEDTDTSLVYGTVVDDQSLPLSGVTLYNPRNNKSVLSADDGMFHISAKEGDSLQVTYVGYSDRIEYINEEKKYEIRLTKKESDMEEVVIVGYGTQKKVNLTGAVAQVSGEVLEDRPVANITQALQGVIPNVNITFGDGRPGAEGRINIRGNTSINSGGAPLILIDGVPGNLNNINPRDVENISVLKDAASAAIYGARGSFGVILITTKKPKNGEFKIDYSNNFGWSGLTTSTDFITDGYRSARLNDEAFLRATGNTYTMYTDEDYEELRKRQTDKSLPDVVISNRKGRDQYVYYGSTDWWDVMFKDWQPSSDHSISISGGTEKIDFLISGRLYNKEGVMKVRPDHNQAYYFRAKMNARITDNFEVYTNTYFNSNRYTYPGWGVNNNFVSVTVHALPSYLPQNPDGTATYRTELNNYTIGDGVFADLLYGKSKGELREFELVNMVGTTYKPFKGAEINANYSYTYNPTGEMQRRTASPWSIYPGVIDYVGFDQLNEMQATRQYNAVNIYGSYAKKLNEHNFKIMAGFNQEWQLYKRIGATNTDLLSSDLNDFNLATGQALVTGGADEWALRGYFSRLNYDYKGKYLLELNGRYDGSSRFPKNNRYGFFPSISAGWRISEESFWSSLHDVVNDLKFRASYGSLGNQQEADYYGYISRLRRGTLPYILNGARVQYLAVPMPVVQNLTWEKSQSVNFGIDVAMLKNRLSMTYDWYIRNTLDMLIPGKTLPSVFGELSPKTNAGDLQTRGWELYINWNDSKELAGRPFRYNVSFGIGDYRSKITRFDNPQGLLNNYYVGQEIGEIWGYRTDGYFKTNEEATAYGQIVNQDFVNRQRRSAPGEWSQLQAGDLKFVDVNGDGVVDNGKNTLEDHGDLVKLGNKQPRFMFGMNMGASWNGIDISAFIQGIGKQNWYPGNNADKFWGPYSRPYFSFIPNDFESKVWSEENPDAYFPKLRGYDALNSGGSLNSINDRYLQDLAYVRLKNLTIGYSLPTAFLSRYKIYSCRFYVSGDNIFTKTKLETKYIDPEQAAMEANGRVYPMSKIYSVGLSVSFK